MKKLMIAAAALAAVATAGAVESANIVGYTTVTIPAQQYTMIGVQFDGLDGEGISVQDLFQNPLGQGIVGAANPNLAANSVRLQYWDPAESGHYVTLYLNNSTQAARSNQWCLAAAPADTSWGTARNVASTKRLTSGMGLWLIRPEGTYDQPLTLTMAGQVVIAQSGRTYVCREGYTMISGGFTTGFAPNPDVAGVGDAIDWLSKGFVGAANPNLAANADRIQFWDPTESGKYVTLYLNNASAQPTRYNKWCLVNAANDTSWGSARNVATPKVIPEGRGFWLIRPSGSGELTFTLPQPYTL